METLGPKEEAQIRIDGEDQIDTTMVAEVGEIIKDDEVEVVVGEEEGEGVILFIVDIYQCHFRDDGREREREHKLKMYEV